jgi:hypothetical protein
LSEFRSQEVIAILQGGQKAYGRCTWTLYEKKLAVPSEAVSQIKNGSTLYFGMAVGSPPALLDQPTCRHAGFIFSSPAQQG